MLITLEELEQHRVVVSKTYAPGTLDYHGAEFRQSGPLEVNAIGELVGSEVRIRGNLTTRLEACCDRCLGPVDLPLKQDFELFYRPVESIAREEEIEVSEDELEVAFFSGSGIELADVVTEQVILAVPMKIVCREKCLGLCPVCGANRNQQACGCSPPAHESPFASLREG